MQERPTVYIAQDKHAEQPMTIDVANTTLDSTIMDLHKSTSRFLRWGRLSFLR
jgi:hypothetical protein